MTIERGQPWGEAGPLPPDGVLVRSDAEARAVVERARRAGEPPPPLGLLGGDLCRTLGGTGDERRVEALQVGFARPLDVWLDGERLRRATHLSLRLEPAAVRCVV